MIWAWDKVVIAALLFTKKVWKTLFLDLSLTKVIFCFCKDKFTVHSAYSRVTLKQVNHGKNPVYFLFGSFTTLELTTLATVSYWRNEQKPNIATSCKSLKSPFPSHISSPLRKTNKNLNIPKISKRSHWNHFQLLSTGQEHFCAFLNTASRLNNKNKCLNFDLIN